MIRGIYAVWVLDMKRFWLEKARLAAGLAQPLLYLFVLGSGLGASSQLGAGDYRRFIFPGVLGLSLLFTAIFAAITIVFDRQIGFFKAVLIAPVPRAAIAVGKILAGATQGFLQGFIVLPFAPLAGLPLSLGEIIRLLGAMAVSSILFSALGVAVACRFKSVTVFPIISNAVILPMFFLAGALYPLSLAPHWMQVAAQFDPVAYGVDLMRGAVLGVYFFPVWQSIVVAIGVSALLTASAVRVFSQGEDDSSLGETQFKWRR